MKTKSKKTTNSVKIAKCKAQQGDVLMRRVETIPVGEKKLIKKNGKGEMVLAEGEVTGHYHGIYEPASELFSIEGKIYMDLKNPATLNHQEHGAITLDAGCWEIGIVQEYDYFSKMVRKVED